MNDFLDSLSIASILIYNFGAKIIIRIEMNKQTANSFRMEVDVEVLTSLVGAFGGDRCNASNHQRTGQTLSPALVVPDYHGAVQESVSKR